MRRTSNIALGIGGIIDEYDQLVRLSSLDVGSRIQRESKVSSSMKSCFLSLIISLVTSCVERKGAYIDKYRGFIVDCIEVELDLLVAPFIRDFKLCSEPGVLDRSVHRERCLYPCYLFSFVKEECIMATYR